MTLGFRHAVGFVRRGTLALLLAGLGGMMRPDGVRAQDPGVDGSQVDARATIVTREQLEAALADADQLANSTAFSATIREQKRHEAALIRERLTEGDFLVGDAIILSINSAASDSGLSGTHTVAPGRVLQLPNLPDIPMRGVLRSEVESHLQAYISRYLRDAQVRARPQIRLTILGGVNTPGFYQLDAEMLLSDALMQAGGISNATDIERSTVKRNNEEIVDRATFTRAVREGITLDQLNLRAGDQIEVGQKGSTNWWTTVRTIALVPGLILSTYGVGRLLGIF